MELGNSRQESSFVYQRHRPEGTLLYRVVQNTWPHFLNEQELRGTHYSLFIRKVFDEFIKCGIPEYGFVRLYCKDCRHSHVLAFSCKRRGFCPSCHARRMNEVAVHLVDAVLPQAPYRQWVLSLPFELRYAVLQDPKLTSLLLSIFIKAVKRWLKNKAKKIFGISDCISGSISFIQRAGSALNSNPHFHVLFLDGVYYKKNCNQRKELSGHNVEEDSTNSLDYKFRYLPAPTKEELRGIVSRIYRRARKMLKNYGIDERTWHFEGAEMENLQQSFFTGLGHIKVREKLVPILNQSEFDDNDPYSAKDHGFSLNAKIGVPGHKPEKLEKLIRYMARGPFALHRLEDYGDKLGYTLKTPWRNGATHVAFTSKSLVQRLVALIPPPRANLLRYHGVFAPNSHLRKVIAPKNKLKLHSSLNEGQNNQSKSNKILWADLIQRVFKIDATLCKRCKGRLVPLAVIKDPKAIKDILQSLGESTVFPKAAPTRGPPADEFMATRPLNLQPNLDQRPIDW